MPASISEPIDWSNWQDPMHWATVALKYERALPFTLSLLPLMLGGWVVGGAAASVLGLGRIFTYLLQAFTSGVLSRAGESALEAGDSYTQAIAEGHTPEEANAIFDQVFRENMLLAGADAFEIAIALAPTPHWVPSRLVQLGLVRTVMMGGRMVIVGLSEGGEEVYQDIIQRRAAGEEIHWDPVMQECFAIGYGMGVFMGLGGDIIVNFTNRVQDNLSDESRQILDDRVNELREQEGAPQAQAQLQAIGELSGQIPEVREVTAQAISDISADINNFTTRIGEYLTSQNYNAQQATTRITEIQEALATSGELAAEVGTRADLEIELARLEAQRGLASMRTPQQLDSIRTTIQSERSSRARGEAAHLFTEYTTAQLEEQLRVYEAARKPSKAVTPGVTAITHKGVAPRGLSINERIQGVREHYRERGANISEIKQTLYDIAKDAPAEVRARMLAAMKNVETATQLAEAVDRIGRLDEQHRQNELRNQIRRELKLIKPTKRRGILRGKFTAEVQTQLETIRDNLDADRDMVREKIANNLEAVDRGELGYDEMLEANELLNLAGIGGMNSQELQVVLDNIVSLKEHGRILGAELREREQERINGIRAEIIGVLTGGRGLKPGVGTVPSSELEATRGFLEKLVNWQFSWDNLLDKLSKFHQSQPYHSPLSEFGNVVHAARSNEDAGVETAFRELVENLKRIFNVRSRWRVNQLLNRMTTTEIDLGTFKTLDGVEISLSLTKDQIISKYQQLQDSTLEGTFTEGMRWTIEMRQAVVNNLTAQERAWADYQMEFYQQYYDSVNKIYSAIYGVNLPHNDFYSPIRRDFEAEVPENVLVYKDLSQYASVESGSLKARVRNIRPLKFNGATGVLINHILQMEHFKGWAYAMRDLRRIFGSREVRTAIRQYHGVPIQRSIDQFLNDMARNGVERARINRGADFLRRNFTISILGIKPQIALKQIPSVLAYSTEMPIGDFVSGIAEFWANPIEHFKFLRENSVFMRDRFGAGFERDIRFAMRTQGVNQLTGKRSVKTYFMALVRMGDKLAVTQGMWAKYKSALRQGMTTEQAIAAAEQTTQRTQPTSRLETLSALQNGGSWLKLLTMFQNQPNKYFRIMADNARNFRYGRGSRVKASANLLLVWVILPALFQLIADAFQWKKEHQFRAWVLGPLNWLLIIGQMFQSVYGWITDEPFDYQASPVLQTMRDIQNLINRVQGMIEAGQDPYESITMDDLIAAVEYFAKAAGQLTGLPTPWLIQAERGIRAGEPLELIFSRWSLQRPEQDAFTQANELLENLGRRQIDIDLESDDPQIRIAAEEKLAEWEEAIAEGLTVEPLEIYDLRDWYSDMRRLFGNVLPSDILSDANASPLVRAWATIEQFRAEADILPNVALYKINTDADNGDTIIQYYTQWQARQQIDNLADLREFDSLYPQAYLGNVTARQFELLAGYLNAEDQDAFLEEHPELLVNPRDEWLRANPEGNAYLALVGQARILTLDAYNTARELVDTLDIPDGGLLPSSLPPENVIEPYFAYWEAVDQFGANSAEARLIRMQNPEFQDWGQQAYGWEDVGGSVEALEISVQWRELDEQYSGFSDRDSEFYIADTDARDQARLELLASNPEYADDRRRRDAYGLELPANLIEDYVQWFSVTRRGFSDDWFLMEHREFYEAMVALDQIQERDFSGVPDIRYREYWENWTSQDAHYEGFSDRDSEFYISNTDARAEAREQFLRANPQYAQARRMREAILHGLPEAVFNDYVGWYEVEKPEGYEYSLWYEDDWYLLEHPEFYLAMLESGVWTEPRDFSTVPTRQVWTQYVEYLALPTGQPRRDFRAAHPELDAWLVVKFGYTPIGGRGDEEHIGQTWEEMDPWQQFATIQGLRTWLDTLPGGARGSPKGVQAAQSTLPETSGVKGLGFGYPGGKEEKLRKRQRPLETLLELFHSTEGDERFRYLEQAVRTYGQLAVKDSLSSQELLEYNWDIRSFDWAHYGILAHFIHWGNEFWKVFEWLERGPDPAQLERVIARVPEFQERVINNLYPIYQGEPEGVFPVATWQALLEMAVERYGAEELIRLVKEIGIPNQWERIQEEINSIRVD